MECPICLGPLNRCPEGIEDNVRRRLTKIRTATCCCTPCGHIFHKACLLTWLDHSNRPPCPVCNVKLSKMKLYPAYLNVDKKRESGGAGVLGSARGGVKQEAAPAGVGTSSRTGSGNRSSTATATVSMSSLPVTYVKTSRRHQGTSVTDQQPIAGTSSKLSSFAPGISGLTTMTIGTYALTTFGPLPVITAAALGALPGTTVPRAHPQPLGNVGNSSDFANFPQSPLAATASATSSAAGRGQAGAYNLPETQTTSTLASAMASVEAQHQQQLRGISGTIPGGSGVPTAQSGTTWHWGFTGDSAYNAGTATGTVSTSTHHRAGGGGGAVRYIPYRQPPPAHGPSPSIPRRTINVLNYNIGHGTEVVTNTNNNATASGVNGGNRGSDGTRVSPVPPRIYVRTPNVHEYQIQSEP